MREPSEWSGGPSEIEGKTTRVGASECGQRTSFNRTREAGNGDEVEGVVTNILGFSRNRDRGLIVTSGSLISVPLVAQTVRFQFSTNLCQTPHNIDVRRRER